MLLYIDCLVNSELKFYSMDVINEEDTFVFGYNQPSCLDGKLESLCEKNDIPAIDKILASEDLKKSLSLPQIYVICSKYGHIDTLKYLHKYLVNNDFLYDTLQFALCFAVENNQYGVVEFLLDCGARPNCKYVHTDYGYLVSDYTPLEYAIVENNFDIVSLLLERGASIAKSKSALILANKNFDMIKYLIDKGADVNSCHHGEFHINTPLISIAQSNRPNIEIFNYLIDHGADIKIHGGDIIARAFFKKNIEIIKICIENDIYYGTFDCNYPDPFGSYDERYVTRVNPLKLLKFFMYEDPKYYEVLEKKFEKFLMSE